MIPSSPDISRAAVTTTDAGGGPPRRSRFSLTVPASGVTEPQRLFQVQKIPGKGIGLIAAASIPRGTRLIAEKPILITRHLKDEKLMNAVLAVKLQRLTKDKQQEFLSLHNAHSPSPTPLTGILQTNALPCGFNELDGAVYATICRLNHSCLPNCMSSWDPERRRGVVHAIRAVEAGEELTLQYTNLPSPLRCSLLKTAFGFVCTCALCSLAPAEIEASDRRRAEIQRLSEAVEDQGRVSAEPNACLLDCHALLHLLRLEYGDEAGASGGAAARAWFDACQVCMAHGDYARASAFAARAWAARAACEGPDSPAAGRMWRAMEDPVRELGVAESRAWLNAASMVPVDLDGRSFEVWLWRQGTVGRLEFTF